MVHDFSWAENAGLGAYIIRQTPNIYPLLSVPERPGDLLVLCPLSFGWRVMSYLIYSGEEEGAVGYGML